MTNALASRASWLAIERTTPAAPGPTRLCPRTKAAVFEQPLPPGQARIHKGRTDGEVNVARQRCDVACLDGYILRQHAVASPVREAEHQLSYRRPVVP